MENDICEYHPLLYKLEEIGVSIDAMIKSALELYVPPDTERKDNSVDKVASQLRSMLIAQCNDINIWLLFHAAIYLDTFWKKNRLRFTALTSDLDPAFIMTDELIGMCIAEYIGGKKALFNFIRYDKHKPGIIRELDVFLDDAVAGLIAGCMTKIFDK